jgi:outer membrane receptor protein involved in Fe transport
MLRRLSAILLTQAAAAALLTGAMAADAPPAAGTATPAEAAPAGAAPVEAAPPGDAPAQPVDASGAAGESIVVTAQRRRENVQNVPIPVTAIGGDKLDAQGIVGFEDLTARVPSMRFGSGVTGGEHVITMRGLGSQNTTSGGDSPVAYSVDGVYMARSTAVDPEYFDVNRIEILRGPQGTLYGRNSVGGSVNVITNRPNADGFEGYADVQFGNYEAVTVRGWVNAALTDPESDFKVSARLTGVYAEHDAYQDNLSDLASATHDSDAQDFYLIRGSRRPTIRTRRRSRPSWHGASRRWATRPGSSARPTIPTRATPSRAIPTPMTRMARSIRRRSTGISAGACSPRSPPTPKARGSRPMMPTRASSTSPT